MRKIIIKIINPLHDERWNEKLLVSHNSSVFHTANWAKLLSDSYGYRPSYFEISDNTDFIGCMPMTEVSSFFTGKRGVCLSFSDYCSATVTKNEDFQLLFRAAVEYGVKNKWEYIEFRGEPFLDEQHWIKEYVHHVVELTPNEDVMAARLRDSTARNIRKATKQGVSVEVTRSMEAVQDFYRLHCLTRKRHGLPPQPFSFFKNLHNYIIADGLGVTALAKYGESVVAAIICLSFGTNAVYKYGASDFAFQHLRANNLLLWESMRTYALQGCKQFSLGRTDLDNEGLLAFKNGWGARASNLHYYRYDLYKHTFSSITRKALNYTALLKKMPICLLRSLGRIAYRHIG